MRLKDLRSANGAAIIAALWLLGGAAISVAFAASFYSIGYVRGERAAVWGNNRIIECSN